MEFTVANILGIVSMFLTVVLFFTNLVFAPAFKLNAADRQNIRDTLQAEKDQRLRDHEAMQTRVENLEKKQQSDSIKIFNELSALREDIAKLLGRLGDN